MRSEQTRDTSKKILPEIIIFALKLVVISSCYGNFALPFFNQFFLVSHSLQQITENIAKIMLMMYYDIQTNSEKILFDCVLLVFSNDGGKTSFGASTHATKLFFPLCSKKRESFLTRRKFVRDGRESCAVFVLLQSSTNL